MRSFKDTTGQAWEMALSYGATRRIAALTGVNFLGGSVEDLGRLVADLAPDTPEKTERFVNVIYAALKPQLDAAGISDEQFAERLSEETLEAAGMALMEALTDFCRSPRREVLGAALERTRAAKAGAERAVAELVRSPEFAAAVDKGIAEASSSSAASSPPKPE